MKLMSKIIGAVVLGAASFYCSMKGSEMYSLSKPYVVVEREEGYFFFDRKNMAPFLASDIAPMYQQTEVAKKELQQNRAELKKVQETIEGIARELDSVYKTSGKS